MVSQAVKKQLDAESSGSGDTESIGLSDQEEESGRGGEEENGTPFEVVEEERSPTKEEVQV